MRRKPLRKIDLIIVHCSDSDLEAHDNIADIRRWHLERGFKDIGYHFVILKNGTIEHGRPLGRRGAHCKGFNNTSVGICLTGKHNFSIQQFDSLKVLVQDLMDGFGLERKDVLHHNELNKGKTCPNFNLWEVL